MIINLLTLCNRHSLSHCTSSPSFPTLSPVHLYGVRTHSPRHCRLLRLTLVIGWGMKWGRGHCSLQPNHLKHQWRESKTSEMTRLTETQKTIMAESFNLNIHWIIIQSHSVFYSALNRFISPIGHMKARNETIIVHYHYIGFYL